MHKSEFYSKLKPRVQKEISDRSFTNIIEIYKGFFKGTENGFQRAIVHSMKYELHEFFPPYVDDFQKTIQFIPYDQSNTILAQHKIPSDLIFIKEGEAYGSNSTGR